MMHKEYSDRFTLTRPPSVMLKDYCRGCWQCRLEAVDTQISGDTVTVPMLMCKYRAGCELQRRLISTEPQRSVYEQARQSDAARAAKASEVCPAADHPSQVPDAQ